MESQENQGKVSKWRVRRMKEKYLSGESGESRKTSKWRVKGIKEKYLGEESGESRKII